MGTDAMNLEQFQLGLLVAVASVLGVLSAVLVGVGWAMWSWLRGHERGELRWTSTGAELKVESPAQVRYATKDEVRT